MNSIEDEGKYPDMIEGEDPKPQEVLEEVFEKEQHQEVLDSEKVQHQEILEQEVLEKQILHHHQLEPPPTAPAPSPPPSRK